MRTEAGLAMSFALVGATVALAYVLAFLGLQALGLGRAEANAAAFLGAVALQYLGQTIFTFRRPLALLDQATRFVVMILLGLVVSALITTRIGPALGLADMVSAVIVTVVLPVQNFILMRFWVYAGRAPQSEGR
jgi:putative flippase GtrA